MVGLFKNWDNKIVGYQTNTTSLRKDTANLDSFVNEFWSVFRQFAISRSVESENVNIGFINFLNDHIPVQVDCDSVFDGEIGGLSIWAPMWDYAANCAIATCC